MERQAAQRTYDELHKDRPYHDGSFTVWAKEFDPDTAPFHYMDGVSIWVAPVDHSPDDDFLSPAGPPAEARDQHDDRPEVISRGHTS